MGVDPLKLFDLIDENNSIFFI